MLSLKIFRILPSETPFQHSCLSKSICEGINKIYSLPYISNRKTKNNDIVVKCTLSFPNLTISQYEELKQLRVEQFYPIITSV